MMKLYVCALILFSLLAATTAQKPTPSKCPSYKEKYPYMSADMVNLTSVMKLDNIVLFKTQLDYKKRAQANVILSINPDTGEADNVAMRVVINYATQTIYTIPFNDPKLCQHFPFYLPMIDKIPDNATYLGSGVLGGGPLPVDYWRFTLNDYTITLAVSADGNCFPVFETVSVKGRPQDDVSYMISNQELKLLDPDAFIIPDKC